LADELKDKLEKQLEKVKFEFDEYKKASG